MIDQSNNLSIIWHVTHIRSQGNAVERVLPVTILPKQTYHHGSLHIGAFPEWPNPEGTWQKLRFNCPDVNRSGYIE
jgi:hypothetical protein